MTQHGTALTTVFSGLLITSVAAAKVAPTLSSAPLSDSWGPIVALIATVVGAVVTFIGTTFIAVLKIRAGNEKLKADIEKSIGVVKTDMVNMKGDLRKEMQSVKDTLCKDIDSVGKGLSKDLGDVRKEINDRCERRGIEMRQCSERITRIEAKIE